MDLRTRMLLARLAYCPVFALRASSKSSPPCPFEIGHNSCRELKLPILGCVINTDVPRLFEPAGLICLYHQDAVDFATFGQSVAKEDVCEVAKAPGILLVEEGRSRRSQYLGRLQILVEFLESNQKVLAKKQETGISFLDKSKVLACFKLLPQRLIDAITNIACPRPGLQQENHARMMVFIPRMETSIHTLANSVPVLFNKLFDYFQIDTLIVAVIILTGKNYSRIFDLQQGNYSTILLENIPLCTPHHQSRNATRTRTPEERGASPASSAPEPSCATVVKS